MIFPTGNSIEDIDVADVGVETWENVEDCDDCEEQMEIESEYEDNIVFESLFAEKLDGREVGLGVRAPRLCSLRCVGSSVFADLNEVDGDAFKFGRELFSVLSDC